MKKGNSRVAAKKRLILSEKFLTDLEKHWTERGHRAIEMVFQHQPEKYLTIVASILPKEFDVIVENRLQEVSDEELDRVIEAVRERRIALANLERGEDQTLN